MVSRSSKKVMRMRPVVVAALCSIMMCCLCFTAPSRAAEPASSQIWSKECIEWVLQGWKSEGLGLKSASDLCYQLKYNEALLNDFAIRRERYVNQVYYDNVLLWVVVVITISGVLLSAFQLFMSYRALPKGAVSQSLAGDLSIEATKINLKSSVVGLSILVVSLAFFVIYVYGVYKINENTNDGFGGLAGLAAGGLGPPPAQ